MNDALKDLFISITYWTVVVMILATVRFYGIESFVETRDELPMRMVYLSTLPGGLILGVVWGLIEIVDKRIKGKSRRSFGITVISKSLIYLAIFLGISFVGAWIGSWSLDIAKDYALSPLTIGNLIVAAIAGFLFLFFKLMNQRFGPGVLMKYLSGKYFNPKEEERIFLFIDLKSSTSIAEKLSHIPYSRFIQDCFVELTEPVISYKAEIYQYVGDEVVITWPKDRGLKQLNCLEFFFAFTARLKEKSEHFLNVYNVIPTFKAGMSMGFVTVAEVGELKTEIAYHGDVLNTASRIQDCCNEFGKRLLISESVFGSIGTQLPYIIKSMGHIQLRGKDGDTEIYSVDNG